MAVIVVAGCGGGDHKSVAGCSAQPATHALTYRARSVATPAAMDATVRKLCDRARGFRVAVDVQRVGTDRIEIRSEKQLSPPVRSAIGTTARLAFYDWEPNVLPPGRSAPIPSLDAAVRMAATQHPRAEATDVPNDRQNDAGVGAGPAPRGIVVLKNEPPAGGYWVLEDDAELTGADITSPKQSFDPQTSEPIVSFGFTPKGKAAFARATKREAVRGQNIKRGPGQLPQDSFQRFAMALDGQIVSLATVSYIDNPDGIDGSTGAQINGLGDITSTRDLAVNLSIGPLPVDLMLVSSR
jgi:preprotein translocase subunit SecD